VISRRTFVVVLGAVLASPLAAEAQPAGRVWRIGIFQTSAPKDEPGRVAALEQGLAELGYLGGRNILIVVVAVGGVRLGLVGAWIKKAK